MAASHTPADASQDLCGGRHFKVKLPIFGELSLSFEVHESTYSAGSSERETPFEALKENGVEFN